MYKEKDERFFQIKYTSNITKMARNITPRPLLY